MNNKKILYIIFSIFGLTSCVSATIIALLLIINNDDNSTDTNNSYKDGTYTATSEYSARGHSESITVEITIENGIVTSVNNTHSGNDRESIEYQESFEQVIDSYTEGKDLDDISLSRVGGASDTTKAFMSALNEIKQDAEN